MPPLRSGLLPQAGRAAGGKQGGASRTSMMLGGSEIDGAAGVLLLADEIFGQIAGGGILIILSGVIGAFVIGAIANMDDLEESYRENNPNAMMETKDGRREALQRIGDIEDLPSAVEKELQDGGDTKK